MNDPIVVAGRTHPLTAGFCFDPKDVYWEGIWQFSHLMFGVGGTGDIWSDFRRLSDLLPLHPNWCEP